MNKLKYKSPWTESWMKTGDELKQRLESLSDEDLNFPNGKEDAVLGRIKGKVGNTKEKLRNLFSKL